MDGFALGVISSLVATALTLALGWIGSRRIRRLPILALSHATGIGVERVYSQQRLANADLAADLAKARWVKVFAGRGNELTRDSFQGVWQAAGNRLESVQVLLPDPGGAARWLGVREEEMRRLDPGFEAGLLAKQVRPNIEYISAIADRSPAVSLRLYDLPNTCRVVATDRVAYLTTYTVGAHGRNSPCLVFRDPSPMYDFALRIFSTAWQGARRA